jgi:flavin-dependent dehydrogenase
MDTFDVAVVGAGPAGSAAAIALRHRGVSTVVLESELASKWRVGETLPPVARPILEALGVVASLASDGHLASYGNCSAWGTGELASTDFIFGPHGNGWQLDREQFDARLARTAQELGASLWYGCRLGAIRRITTEWELEATVDRVRRAVRAQWLVDATGRRGVVARQLGVRRVAVDTLVAVYAVMSPTRDERPLDSDTRTLVESVPEGWWYTVLVPGGRRTLAWLTDADLLRGKPWQEAKWFGSSAGRTRHLGPLLDRHGYALVNPPRCTSANSSRSELWCGPGWIATGDAALALDPLSSQGLLNALESGLRGGVAIADTLFGDQTAVTRYSDALAAIWATYIRNRLTFYRMERRWAGWPFWDRRHEDDSPATQGISL